MVTRRGFLKGLVAVSTAIALPSLALAKPDIHTMVIHHAAKPKIDLTKPNFMYLEVSARRSGKTMRLFKHMLAYIQETGNDVYYVTGNANMFWHSINEYAPKEYLAKIHSLPMEIDKREDLRYYYDEAGLVAKPFQVVKQDAYYVGTPQGKDNWLYELAQYNDMQYEKFSIPYYKDTWPEDWMQKENWTTEYMYNQEVLGKFK